MTALRQLGPALRMWAVLTVLLGLLYPLALVGVGRLMPGRADGSLVTVDDAVVGSALVAQPFDQPGYFWPRDSVGGYDMLATGGSNLGPNNPDLVEAIAERRATLAEANGVPIEELPADAVTASGSGLDPQISPQYARLQAARVAEARGLPLTQLRAVVDDHVQGRVLGVLGEPTVNVLELNLAVDRLARG